MQHATAYPGKHDQMRDAYRILETFGQMTRNSVDREQRAVKLYRAAASRVLPACHFLWLRREGEGP